MEAASFGDLRAEFPRVEQIDVALIENVKQIVTSKHKRSACFCTTITSLADKPDPFRLAVHFHPSPADVLIAERHVDELNNRAIRVQR